MVISGPGTPKRTSTWTPRASKMTPPKPEMLPQTQSVGTKKPNKRRARWRNNAQHWYYICIYIYIYIIYIYIYIYMYIYPQPCFSTRACSKLHQQQHRTRRSSLLLRDHRPVTRTSCSASPPFCEAEELSKNKRFPKPFFPQLRLPAGLRNAPERTPL